MEEEEDDLVTIRVFLVFYFLARRFNRRISIMDIKMIVNQLLQFPVDFIYFLNQIEFFKQFLSGLKLLKTFLYGILDYYLYLHV